MHARRSRAQAVFPDMIHHKERVESRGAVQLIPRLESPPTCPSYVCEQHAPEATYRARLADLEHATEVQQPTVELVSDPDEHSLGPGLPRILRSATLVWWIVEPQAPRLVPLHLPDDRAGHFKGFDGGILLMFHESSWPGRERWGAVAATRIGSRKVAARCADLMCHPPLQRQLHAREHACAAASWMHAHVTAMN